jgi:hypothetical protein
VRNRHVQQRKQAPHATHALLLTNRSEHGLSPRQIWLYYAQNTKVRVNIRYSASKNRTKLRVLHRHRRNVVHCTASLTSLQFRRSLNFSYLPSYTIRFCASFMQYSLLLVCISYGDVIYGEFEFALLTSRMNAVLNRYIHNGQIHMRCIDTEKRQHSK